jgi:hypothetical protein
MKKLMFLIFLLANCPLIAGINCLDNSKHLQEDYDDKEWRSVACDCACEHEIIRGNKCTQCGHLQNASTYIVVMPTKVAQQTRKYPSYDPKDVLRQLTHKFLHKKN